MYFAHIVLSVFILFEFGWYYLTFIHLFLRVRISIELGEVELAIANHPDVEQAVVIVRDQALVAYIKLHPVVAASAAATSKNGSNSLHNATISKIKALISKSLPSYMVPRLFMVVDDFPKTANGKLDKMNLPAVPLPTSSSSGAFAADDDASSGAGGGDDTGIAMSNFGTSGGGGTQGVALRRIGGGGGGGGGGSGGAGFGGSVNLTMLDHVTNLVFRATGQKPRPGGSFVSVGVDSLAAMMFSNSLSASLGNVTIDVDQLYDSETTIESFAVRLYDKMLIDKQHVLTSAHITKATNRNQSDVESRDVDRNVDEDDERDAKAVGGYDLPKILLSNRRFFDGMRGYLSILVLIDHYFYNAWVTRNFKLKVDTLLFVLLTGFTTILMDIVSTDAAKKVARQANKDAGRDPNFNISNRTVTNWNTAKFLYMRWIGLFPILWVSIILNIPRLIETYPMRLHQMSPTQYKTYMTLSVLGLQSWSINSNVVLHDVYYISMLWSVFCVYALCKCIHHSNYRILPDWVKGIMYGGIAYGLYQAYLYHPTGGTHPPRGAQYFFLGALVAYTFDYWQKEFNLPTAIKQSRVWFGEYVVVPAVFAKDVVYTLAGVPPGQNTSMTIFSLPYERTHLLDACTSSSSNSSGQAGNSNAARSSNEVLLHQALYWMWIFSPDAIMVLFNFLLFYNNWPGGNHTRRYHVFEVGMIYWFLPFLFIVFVMITLLQPVKERKSIFLYILDTRGMVWLGEISLTLYVVQNVFINYYFRRLIETLYPHLIPAWYIIAVGSLAGISAVFGFSHFLQKIFQERWVARAHVWFWKNYDELMVRVNERNGIAAPGGGASRGSSDADENFNLADHRVM